MRNQEAYHYMRGLQDQFFQELQFPELQQRLDQIHQELSQQMDKETRKKFLYLIDTADELQERISLASFIAGFRLATGLARELSLEDPYSFDKVEENRISRTMGDFDEQTSS